ncbi:MAG: hypothetical protein AAB553_04405 [Patescibacteria group bacterium]
MKQKCGIIFLDASEVIVRIYEVTDKEWSLFYFHTTTLQFKTIRSLHVTEILADFFLTKPAQEVNDWKICTRQLSLALTNEVSLATGMQIERLTPIREQELLCRGMFTELW